MWQDDDLHTQLQSDYMVPTAARVLAEFNVNAVATPLEVGVYAVDHGQQPFGLWHPGDKFYVHSIEQPHTAPLMMQQRLLEQYYSLADCFKFRRPRAGIIYPLFPGEETKLYIENYTTARRPRYYITGRNQEFKYWNSAVNDSTSDMVYNEAVEGYPINNVAPFVVYDGLQYANKLVIKLQTYNGERRYDNDPVADTWRIPTKWYVETLNADGAWQLAHELTAADIPTDGHVELMYGVIAPIGYQSTFRLYGSVEYEYELEQIPMDQRHPGMSYKYQQASLRVWDGAAWTDQPLTYGWMHTGHDMFEYAITAIDPPPDEFVVLRGVRIVVQAMSQPNIPFELIELSPRLQIDITDHVESFDLNKSLGLGDMLPFGQLSNDLGSLSLMNYDEMFSPENHYIDGAGSIIAQYMSENTKITFYNEIKQPTHHNSKYVQLKTMYVEQWPLNDPGSGDMTINLRDYYLFFEKLAAPDMLFQNISLTYTVSLLLDNVGFTNYAFIGFDASNDVIIPYFACNSTSNLLDVLNNLVRATRTAMYFDEYNNFIMVSKEYLSGVGRSSDTVLYGTSDDEVLSNIETLSLERKQLYNDGLVQFSPMFIKKGAKTADTVNFMGRNHRYGYQPTKLWELAVDEAGPYSSPTQSMAEFTLSAAILNTALPDTLPKYNATTGTITDNIIDLGSSVYFLGRFSGYLYANSEIIRYDAIEYNIGGVGKVWISYHDQYAYYINSIGFDQYIERTGRIRIWTEIEWDVLRNHGRGCFGTPIVNHSATADPFWKAHSGWQAMEQEYAPLFTPCAIISFLDYDIHPDPATRWAATNVGSPGTLAPAPTFVTQTRLDASNNRITAKMSALNWKGPQQSALQNARTLNYFRRKFPADVNYTRFGTRLRIVGEPRTGDENSQQQPESNIKLFESTASTYINSDCSSGGLSLFTDDRRQGYFLEVLAFSDNLSQATTDCSDGGTAFNQIVFYKVMSVTDKDGKSLSMPFKLWGGELAVALDSGMFASEDRANNDSPNVIDLEVEVYGDAFDIYVNGVKMGTAVDDVNSMIALNQQYFTGDEYEGDQNRNVIRSIPVLGTASKEYGVFIRGDSRVLFENVWAMQKSAAPDAQANDVPAVFGQVEVDNTYGRGDINTMFRRHKLSGFIQQEYLQNIINNGYKYNIDYEEFGTVLRECYLVNARYTEAYPAFYARIVPTATTYNPVAISNELVGQYGTEFMLFNVADKGVVMSNDTALIINGVVLTDKSDMEITVDQYLQRRKSDTNQLRDIQRMVTESRRRYGTNVFSLEPSDYMQSMSQAESILNWALRYLLEEKMWASATVFANPMLQLGDIVVLDRLQGKLLPSGIRMIIDEIDYTYDGEGPTMTLQLREVL